MLHSILECTIHVSECPNLSFTLFLNRLVEWFEHLLSIVRGRYRTHLTRITMIPLHQEQANVQEKYRVS